MKLEFNFTQSGVLPYRRKEGKIEVLLITSIRKRKWIIPKGYVEFNLSHFESAKKEAFEEAGIYGENETIELGSFKVNKAIGICLIQVFSMEVNKILDDYPDKEKRRRKWFTIEEAVQSVERPELKQIISTLPLKLS
ncbi:MAG: NUDIX hydrolase [Ignavibacteriaceae bacterium]|nr:NUDIX hydrolase [Ignavibacteriaceae bacterium]